MTAYYAAILQLDVERDRASGFSNDTRKPRVAMCGEVSCEDRISNLEFSRPGLPVMSGLLTILVRVYLGLQIGAQQIQMAPRAAT